MANYVQTAMTHAQWIANGGWHPAIPTSDDDVVIACIDEDTGNAVWASWASADVALHDRVEDPDTVTDIRGDTSTA